MRRFIKKAKSTIPGVILQRLREYYIYNRTSSISGGSSWPDVAALGTLISKDWTAGADLTGWTFTPQAAATCTVTGGYLRYTSDGNGGFTTANRLVYNTYGRTALNNFVLSIDFLAPANPSVTSSAIGIGVYPDQPLGPGTSTHGMVFFQAGYYGKVNVYANNTSRAGASATGIPTSVAGDLLRLTLTRVGAAYTCLCQNITRSTSDTVTWTETYANTSAINNSSSRPFIQFGLGTFDIKSFSFSSTDSKNIDLAFIGDSITEGYCASSFANRWVTQAMLGNPKTYTALGVQSTYTELVLETISEILNVHAQKYVLMFGGNDVVLGVADATMKANYSSIVSQLKAGGSSVIHCYATPRDSYDMRALNTWISATFPTDTIIDTFTPLVTGSYGLNNTYDIGDGTHPNIAGHALIGSTVLPYLI